MIATTPVNYAEQFGPAGLTLLVIWGLVDCFFGWRFFKVTLTLFGLVGGAYLGLMLVNQFDADNDRLRLIVAVVLAFVGALMAFKILKAAIFLQGIALGILMGPSLVAWLGITAEGAAAEVVPYVVGAVGGALFGALCVVFFKHIVIFYTAAIGAVLTVYGVAALFDVPLIIDQLVDRDYEKIRSFHSEYWYLLPASFVLFCFGTFVQLKAEHGAPNVVEKQGA